MSEPIFRDLSDDLLDAVLWELRSSRHSILSQFHSGEISIKALTALEQEYARVAASYTSALAERTARLALTPEKRAELAAREGVRT